MKAKVQSSVIVSRFMFTLLTIAQVPFLTHCAGEMRSLDALGGSESSSAVPANPSTSDANAENLALTAYVKSTLIPQMSSAMLECEADQQSSPACWTPLFNLEGQLSESGDNHRGVCAWILSAPIEDSTASDLLISDDRKIAVWLRLADSSLDCVAFMRNSGSTLGTLVVEGNATPVFMH